MVTYGLAFADSVAPAIVARLFELRDCIERYLCERLEGEELEPGPLALRHSSQPAIASVQAIREIDIFATEECADGRVRAQCSIDLDLEVDLVDEDDVSEGVTATLRIDLDIDPESRVVVDHRIVDAWAPDDWIE